MNTSYYIPKILLIGFCIWLITNYQNAIAQTDNDCGGPATAPLPLFERATNINNTAGSGAACSFTNEDGWLTVTGFTVGQRYLVRYRRSSGGTDNARVAIHDNDACPGTVRVACIAESENQSVHINFTAATTSHRIRIINATNDGDGMTGFLSVYQSNTNGNVFELYDFVCDTESNGANILDLNNSETAINTTVNLASFYNANTSVISPSCPSLPVPALFKDGWIKIKSNVTGPLVISYSPTSPSLAQDAWLTVYDAANGCAPTAPLLQDNILQCANQYGAGCTETVTINATVNAFYYVRIANTTTTALNGNLTIYSGPKTNYDLFNDAQTILAGNCNVNFNVSGNFNNNEGRTDANDLFTCDTDLITGGTQNFTNTNIDGWLKVQLTIGERIRLAYTNENKDAGLALYSGACGNSLTAISCANSTTGVGIESLEYTAAATGTYYIRVLNLSDDETMSGQVCISKITPRDGCLAAFNSTRLKTGDCNIQFDVLNNSDFTPDALAGSTPAPCISNSNTRKSAWITYQPTANATVRFEYFRTNATQYSIVLYEVTGTAIGAANTFCSNLTNLSASGGQELSVTSIIPPNGYTVNDRSCTDNNSQDYIAFDFNATLGNTYFMEVIKDASASDLTGFACIYENTKKAEDFLFSSDNFDTSTSITDCGRRFNINGSFENFGGYFSGDDIACSDDGAGNRIIPSNDAWANFDISTIPAAGITVNFDNNNNDAALATDVAMIIYRGESKTLATATAQATCATAELLGLDATTNDFLIPDTEERWFRFTASTNPYINIRFESPSDDMVSGLAIDVFSDCLPTPAGGAMLPDINLRKKGWSNNEAPVLTLVNGATYFVRIRNTSGADVTGNLTIISNLLEIACINNVVEGIENVVLTNLTADFLPNYRYYVRVANIPSSVIPVTVTGSLCIANNSLQQGDICSNAFGLQVGDCDINLDLTSEFSVPQPNLPIPNCGANLRDVWIKFIATSEQTTIAFVDTVAVGKNIALQAYSGICGGLNTESICTNDITSGIGIEKLALSTVPGKEYLVQIMNTSPVPVNINGNLCIYDTPHRDECNDNDILTKVVGECNIQFDVPTSFTLSEPFGLRNINIGADGNLASATDPVISITETKGSTIQKVTSSCDFDAGPNNGNANLLFSQGITSATDLCSAAPDMPMNTVSIPFALDNDGTAETPPNVAGTCATTPTGDNWIKFTATADDLAKGVTVAFNHLDGDASLELYEFVTDCNDLIFITCSPIAGTAGVGVKSLFSTVEALKTYYVRIVNHGITQPGTIAIYNRKKTRDAWMRMVGNGNDVTLLYENSNVTSDAAIVVYTALQSSNVVTCGVGTNGISFSYNETVAPLDSISMNQYACANNQSVGAKTEFVTFKTNAGQNYLIRVMDLVGNSGGMTGLLCISDGTQRYPDACKARNISIGDCSVSLDLIDGDVLCDPPTNYTTVNNAGYGQNSPDPGFNNADCPDCQYGDVFARFIRPKVCNPTVAAAINTSNGANPSACTSLGYIYNSTTKKCECPANTIRSDAQYGTITLQYDNRNGILEESGDVSMVIYQLNDTITNPATGACNDITDYTLRGCSNIFTGIKSEGVETFSITGLPVTAAGAGQNLSTSSGGEVFLMRIIRKTPNKTVFGKVCSFYGETVASTNCPPLNSFGDATGEYRDFTIPATVGPTSGTGYIPSNEIPNCVIRGVNGNPTTRNDAYPIRSQAWTKFAVPSDATYTAVTVQFDNTNFVPLRNMALAIYDDDPTTCVGLPLVNPEACSNGTFVGTESVTFQTIPGQTYFIRVMNIHNITNPGLTSGRLRIFPYSPCQRGEELIVDGDFAGWPAIDPGADGKIGDNDSATDNGDALGGFSNQNDNILYIPTITTNDPYPNDLDMNRNVVSGTRYNTGIARFATDYGYTRDRITTSLSNGGNADLPTANPAGDVGGVPFNNFRARYDKLYADVRRFAQGHYTVRQSPFLSFPIFYGFGTLYSGYGGNGGNGTLAIPTNRAYCLTGRGLGSQACTEIDLDGSSNLLRTTGIYNTSTTVGTQGLPEPFPVTSDANFMSLDGNYAPNQGLPPGKAWCQTIQRADSGTVGYYIFEVWTQNLVTVNGEVPQLRLTVCDMENPAKEGDLPPYRDIDLTAGKRRTRLPGITDPKINETDLSLRQVGHFPPPPNNRRLAPRVSNSYGAAVTCNVTDEMRTSIIDSLVTIEGQTLAQAQANAPVKESNDARLKVLGASFLISEVPDNWQLLRCVYKAPRGVKEMNFCIENLSITDRGNDFGIDDISLRECLNPDIEAFERLLKGDPCELTDSPLGTALSARLLSFSGKLLTDKVFLNWITITENSTIRYEIQRSTNGNTFTPIGSVDAKGTSLGLAEYSFIDNNLPLGVNQIFYRLNFINSDGLTKTGPIIFVDIQNLAPFEITLQPNPTLEGDETQVKFGSEAGKAGILVADMTGRQIFSDIFQTVDGDNIYHLNTSNFRQGVYIVKIINSNGQSVAKKLVIQ